MKPHVDHIGIQTRDLDQAEAWYAELLGFERRWSLSTFAARTTARLPGITRLVELASGDVKLHLFERDDTAPAHPIGDRAVQYQHVCLAVDDIAELHTIRERWLKLYESGRYRFAREDPPTEVASDGDGVTSFYAVDVDGLELEFMVAASRAR